MSHKKNDPTYEVHQWTGGDFSAAQDFIELHMGRPVTITVDPDDGQWVAVREGSYFNLFVVPGDVILYGPSYGSDNGEASFMTRQPAQFSAQFSEV